MTTKEMIAVMQAFDEGKQIQRKPNIEGGFYFDEPSPAWDWDKNSYRIKPEEPEYRPYENTEEMILDYFERFDQDCCSYAMPLIWVEYKGSIKVQQLIVAYEDDMVWLGTNEDGFELDQLFYEYTYLDGTPIGKLVE